MVHILEIQEVDTVHLFEILEMDTVHLFQIRLAQENFSFYYFLPNLYILMISEPGFTIYQILPRHGRISFVRP